MLVAQGLRAELRGQGTRRPVCVGTPGLRGSGRLEMAEAIEQALRLARYWFDVAARNGDKAAPGKVQEIDARLAAGVTARP